MTVDRRKLLIHTDGGCRETNPGPAGIGVLIEFPDHPGEKVEIGEYIGTATNNEAEYTAILRALAWAVDHDATEVEIVLDSELVARQMSGEYEVRNLKLSQLHIGATAYCSFIPKIKFRHVKREFNKDADRIYNDAMDRRDEKP